MPGNAPTPSTIWRSIGRASSTAAAACLRLLHERAILVLTLMFCLGVATILWHVSRLSSRLVASVALEGATLHARSLEATRRLYTSEVVERLRSRGIAVTHDYAAHEGAIPLPVTFSMELGRRISQHGSDMQARLYSAYPFPWRQDGGPRDDFEREAMRRLSDDPVNPLVRFEEFQGRPSLRYAIAERMDAGCVACHNTHPDSPKKDWRVGDVRGVLEITRSLDSVVAQTRAGLHETFTLLAGMGLLGVSGLALVISRLRRATMDVRALYGRLLLAQETESRRIAGELHDDLSQGLALLSVEMELLGQSPPKSASQFGGRMQGLSARVQQLSSSVHNLSRQLHPAKLEQLGLVAAVGGLCRELTEGHGLKIEFTHRQVPAAIPQATAVCLYRLVQEGLRNTIKHSGAQHVRVDLKGSADAISLRISDDGTGFDATPIQGREGLGLVSMRERVFHLHGEITIRSRPSNGTQIDVRLPLLSAADQAAG
jgi:signal transduction histidine kinase